MKKQLRNKKKGFTLIELIVVVVILGVLAAVAIPRLTGNQEKAKISADKATLGTLQSAFAIAVANGDIQSDVTITIKADKDDGVITDTMAKVGSNNFKLIESGAAFKLDANKKFLKDTGLQWTIDKDGKITKSPIIDETSGVISNTP